MTKNALIVDDSRLACKVLANMLEPMGLNSVAVYSAEQALEYLQHNQPDIIFLDHTMPGMDGLETIKVIKSNPLTATVPVMMYTAKQGEVYVGQARALGAVDVLPKGMEKEHLNNALQKLGFIKQESSSETQNAVAEKEDIVVEKKGAIDEKKDAVVEKIDTVVEKKASELAHEQFPKIESKPSWQVFWQQRVEPYLKRQKAQQTDELLLYTRKQTRYLTREIHQTLESFEHAMALRMESHDDFLEAEQELRRQGKRKRTAAVVGFVVLLQLVLIVQLWRVQDSNEMVLVAQQQMSEWQEKADKQFERLDAKFVMAEPIQPEQTTQPPVISLRNSQGEHLAEVYSTDNRGGEFSGFTTTGYQFLVNSQGEVGTPLGTQFFLTENCVGDAFVAASAAHLFKDGDGKLWFVDKLAQQVQVNVNSKLTSAGECESLSDELLNLRRLQPNISFETGIEEQESMQLVYSR